MVKLPEDACTHPVQVRFKGSEPVVVVCGRTGQMRPSLIYPRTGIIRCNEHFEAVRPSGNYRVAIDPSRDGTSVVVVDSKMNHMSFELPIPGVW